MGIRLHPTLGVNPGLMHCFFCQEASGLVLAGNACKTETPAGIYDMEPCSKCKELMQQGIILIGVRTGEFEKIEAEQAAARRDGARFIPNPYRTGLWCVVTDDCIRRLISPPTLREQILKCRWTFIDEETAEKSGIKEMAAQMQSA